MKMKLIISILLSNFLYSQLEIKFENSFISGESKISFKQINANSMVIEPSQDLKLWIRSEPRKLTTEEQKYNQNPKNFPLITDYDIYISRINLNCDNKVISLIEMYQYDGATKRLKFHEDYSLYESKGEITLNNNFEKTIQESTMEPHYLLYQKKCENK